MRVRVSVLAAFVCVGGASVCCAQVCDVPQLGRSVFGTHMQGADVSDGVLCVAADTIGMLIYDVSDPANPDFLSFVLTPYSSLGVAIDGTIAFLSDSDVWEGLQSVDISDPDNPVVLHRTHIASGALGLVLDGSVVCVEAASGMLVLDVTNPRDLVVVGELEIEGAVQDLVCEGAFAYVTTEAGLLLVVDVMDPTAPMIRGSASTSGGNLAVSVSVVCVRSPGVFEVFDVRNPAAPAMVGMLELGDFGWGVSMSGSLACITSLGAGVRVFDVSDPTRPVEVGATASISYSYGVHAQGDVAYILENGLRTLDLSRALACAHADLAEPQGALDSFDAMAFLIAFGSGAAEADLAEPEGEFDFSDVLAFIQAFDACERCSPYYSALPEGGRYLYRPGEVWGWAVAPVAVAALGAPCGGGGRRRTRVSAT